MNKQATGVVSYLSWIGWVIAFLFGDRNNAKFHLNQSLVLNIVFFVLGCAKGFFSHIWLVGWIVNWALGIVTFVFGIIWLVSFISAIQDSDRYVPIISDIHLIG